MQVVAARITLYARESQSLKAKRRILRSILDQVRHRFKVSIAEVDDMDLHQQLVIGVSCVSNSLSHAQAELDAVIRFVENQAESAGAVIVSIEDY